MLKYKDQPGSVLASSLTQLMENLGTRLCWLNGKYLLKNEAKMWIKMWIDGRKDSEQGYDTLHRGYGLGQKNELGKLPLILLWPLWPCNG